MARRQTSPCRRRRAYGLCENIRLFFRGGFQWTNADVLECRGALKRRDPQRPAWLDLKSNADLSILRIHVDDLFLIDPRLNPFGLDAQSDVVPPLVLELHDLLAFLVAPVVVAEIPHPSQSPTP